ncbi:Fic family protein, partial [Candidatus Poribacteria bacterium]|nr:Fic family protein [Candidatus Poribacteria bacterium]
MYKPRFDISPKLLSLITLAAEIRAWINSAVVDVSWLPILQRETAARLAHSSTGIEGNPLTLPEVEALARGEEIGAKAKDKQEILNALAAMNWVWNRKAAAPIKESGLLRLHRVLTRKVLPDEQSGHYKTRQNRIVDHRGITVYTRPPPDKAHQLKLELLDWINSKESVALHPVIVSAIVHHRLVSIHPFSDGNGRISRALAIWLLYSRGFDTHHLFALDEYFERERQRYYQKIQQARDLDDDLSYWLEYVAEGVVETLKTVKERILSLKIAVAAPRMLLTKRQEDILRFLRDRGRVKSPDMERIFSLTRARISQIIKPLIDAGLVIR